MSYEVEETGQLSRRAQVSVSTEEFKKRVDSELQKLSTKVDIRGFRKGKVPLGVMRKRYGGKVEGEVIEGLVRDSIDEILQDIDQPVIHLGSPQVESEPDDEEGLRFSVEFELRPEIDPIGYLGLDLERDKVEVSGDEIDERLEQMRTQFATLEPIAFRETIEEGDVVTFDYSAKGDHPELEDFEGENAQVEIGQGRSINGLEEGLIGAEFDSTVVVEVTPDADFPVEDLRGETFDIEVDIKSVKQQVLPELDDEFAKDTGDAETLLELRGQIREELEEEIEHQAMHAAEEQLVGKLLEQNEFDLPPNFVDEQVDHERSRRGQMLQQFTQQGMSAEQLGIDVDEFMGGDEIVEDVKDRVRADFLLLAIAEKEGLELNEEDLMAYIEHRARHSRTSPQQLMQMMMQDQQQLQQANMMALLEKTKRFLLEKAEFTEVEPSDQEEAAEADEAEQEEAEEVEAAEEARAEEAEEAEEEADEAEEEADEAEEEADEAEEEEADEDDK